MGFTLPQITSSRLSNRGCRAAPGPFQTQQTGQDGREACASGQRPQLSVLPEHLAGPADVFHGLCIADWMPGRFQPDGLSRLRCNGGQPALLRNDGGHIGVRTGSKGSCPNTLWATGIPSMSCCPCSVVRFIWGRPVRRTAARPGFLSATASSSAPMLPRSAESVFYKCRAPSWRMPAGRWRLRTPLPAAGGCGAFPHRSPRLPFHRQSVQGLHGDRSAPPFWHRSSRSALRCPVLL